MSQLFSLAPGARLVLASASPRRRRFLEEWGVPFETRPVAGEPDPEEGEAAPSFAVRSALHKLAHADRRGGETVVAADTVVSLSGRVLGKPSSDAGALAMLKDLSGRDHQVITACAVGLADGTRAAVADVCHVHFTEWGEDALAAYVGTGECSDKAGAYAIQGVGAFLADRIRGSWSTVVGLPVSWLAGTLVRKGVLVPAKARLRR